MSSKEFMVDIQRLIHGKNDLKRIVGIETNEDGQAEIFQQSEDGNITSLFVDYKLWCLSNKNINGRFSKLDGDLFV